MSASGEAVPPAVFLDEIDGVPVVWGSVEGPLAASLIFRVGRSDETLVSSGITHLVEHLALFREGLTGEASHFNGQVDDTTASFYLHGEPNEVNGFLDRVTTNLGTLPMERLQTEREILRSEAANRSLGGGYLSLMRWRYGPRTYGLSAYEEFGLRRLEAADVEAWAARMFSRDNAVLMLSGPPPAGLRLNLCGGSRSTPVVASSALPQLPAWYREGDPGAALLATVHRGTPATLLRHVVEQRLRTRLRYDLGASYSPGVAYEPRDGREAHLFIAADAVPEQADAVRREIGTVLTQLTVDDVAAVDLVVWSRGWSQALAEAGARRGWVHTQAMDVLLGRSRLDYEGWLQEVRDLTPEEVVGVAREAHESSLLRLGGEFDGALDDRVAAPVWSAPGHGEGREFEEIRATPDTPGSRLVIGSSSTTVEFDGARRVVVEHAEVAAALTWPDGQVVLMGNDAFQLQIDPRFWIEGRDAVATLHTRLPAERWVSMPERELAPVITFSEPRREQVLLGVAVAAALGVTAVGIASPHAGVFAIAGFLSYASFDQFRRVRALRHVRGLR